jgi:hypothetical protein
VWFSIGILDDNNLVLAPVRLDIVNMKFNKEVFCSLHGDLMIFGGARQHLEKKNAKIFVLLSFHI